MARIHKTCRTHNQGKRHHWWKRLSLVDKFHIRWSYRQWTTTTCSITKYHNDKKSTSNFSFHHFYIFIYFIFSKLSYYFSWQISNSLDGKMPSVKPTVRIPTKNRISEFILICLWFLTIIWHLLFFYIGCEVLWEF